MRLKNNDEVKVKLFGLGPTAPTGIIWGRDELGCPLVCFDYDQIRQFQFPDGSWPWPIRQFSGPRASIVMLLAINTTELQLKSGRAT